MKKFLTVGIDPQEVYLASDVEARVAELKKALLTVAIIDLGFGVPKWFCGGCASYGDGPDSIVHKPECIVSTKLGERA